MGMGISCSISMQHQMIQALQVCGGITESIFPQPEAWLRSKSDHQKALEYVASRKKMDRYESIMDFLFCEIFPEYRQRCFQYYLDGKIQLRDIITSEKLVRFNNILLKSLEVAYDAFCEQQQMSWVKFRQHVLQEVA